jgi:hypothetical protein
VWHEPGDIICVSLQLLVHDTHTTDGLNPRGLSDEHVSSSTTSVRSFQSSSPYDLIAVISSTFTWLIIDTSGSFTHMAKQNSG